MQAINHVAGYQKGTAGRAVPGWFWTGRAGSQLRAAAGAEQALFRD